MFGIGPGEVLIVLLIIFLISPKDIPEVMKKLGEFFSELDKIKKELAEIKEAAKMAGNADVEDEMSVLEKHRNRKDTEK